MSQNQFFSVNAFMKHILDKQSDVQYIDLYFVPSHTFRNQYNNVSIKPIALLIKTSDAAKSFKYNDMISYLGVTPIVSFKQNSDRKIYKKSPMQKLIIKNLLKNHNEHEYYESKIITVTDKMVIEKINADAPKISNITHDDETELFNA